MFHLVNHGNAPYIINLGGMRKVQVQPKGEVRVDLPKHVAVLLKQKENAGSKLKIEGLTDDARLSIENPGKMRLHGAKRAFPPPVVKPIPIKDELAPEPETAEENLVVGNVELADLPADIQEAVAPQVVNADGPTEEPQPEPEVKPTRRKSKRVRLEG